MTEFYDLCLRETSKEIEKLADEIGWSGTNSEFNTVFIEASDWGELKRKIKKE